MAMEFSAVVERLRTMQAEGHLVWSVLEALLDTDAAADARDFETLYAAYQNVSERLMRLDVMVRNQLAAALGCGDEL